MATSFESRRSTGASPRRTTNVDAARWGLRGRINSMLGPAALFSPNSAELDSREDSASICRALPASRRVVIANTDGGMGKTPTTVMLSALFGRARGGDVVAWDVAGVRGNLGRRAATDSHGDQTVWDLLADADRIRGGDVNGSADSNSAIERYLSAQPTGDEILAADRYTRHMESITVAELEAIDGALTENRQITFYDTGNDDRATAWRWATEHADQLVIPLPYRRGAGSAVTSMLATLRARGLESLIERAVVIASHPAREASSDVVADVDRHLAEFGVRRIVVVPFEPLLASWERIDQAALPAPTVRAWTHAAAEVATAMAGGQSAMIVESWTASGDLAPEPPAPETPAPEPTDAVQVVSAAEAVQPDSAAADAVETTVTEPAATEPAATEPAAVEPTATEPAAAESDSPTKDSSTRSSPAPSNSDPTEFAMTTAALRQWSTAPRPQRTSRASISVSKRTAAIAAAALIAVVGVGTWQLTQSEPTAQPTLAMPAAAESAVVSSQSSGPAVIEAYDNRYYADRDAAAAAALWDIDRSDPVEADALVQELQASIDDVDPAIRHRVDVTPTSSPDVFDVVLTLTTGDGVQYPYNQRFTVRDSGGRYSIVDKIDCATTCPAI